MGSFGGHALPGSFFVIFGVWWTVQIFIRYYSCKRRKSKFLSTATFPCSCLCGRLNRWPIEPCIKIFFTAVGGSLEIYTGMRDGKFRIPGNAQHATMFFFFGLTGVMDLLLYFKVSIPQNLDYVSAVMAFMVEWLLFRFHLHGRPPLDVLLHTLLMYAIGANVVSVLIEMKYRDKVLAPLARSYFVFLQGTWFWQIGFILYNPNQNAEKWAPDDHEQMMTATMYFAWHGAIVFLIMLFINGVVSCVYNRLLKHADDGMQMKSLIRPETNGYTSVLVDNCDDSDFEKPS